MLTQPLFNELLSAQRHITLGHLTGANVKYTNKLIIERMDMSRIVFFWLKEHFDDDTIETSYLGHFLLGLNLEFYTLALQN